MLTIYMNYAKSEVQILWLSSIMQIRVNCGGRVQLAGQTIHKPDLDSITNNILSHQWKYIKESIKSRLYRYEKCFGIEFYMNFYVYSMYASSAKQNLSLNSICHTQLEDYKYTKLEPGEFLLFLFAILGYLLAELILSLA